MVKNLVFLRVQFTQGNLQTRQKSHLLHCSSFLILYHGVFYGLLAIFPQLLLNLYWILNIFLKVDNFHAQSLIYYFSMSLFLKFHQISVTTVTYASFKSVKDSFVPLLDHSYWRYFHFSSEGFSIHSKYHVDTFLIRFELISTIALSTTMENETSLSGLV